MGLSTARKAKTTVCFSSAFNRAQGENYSVFFLCVLAVYLGVKSHHSVLRESEFLSLFLGPEFCPKLCSQAPAVSYLSLAPWEDTSFLFGPNVLTADV